MADQPTSQGSKVGRTKVKQQGQTASRDETLSPALEVTEIAAGQ